MNGSPTMHTGPLGSTLHVLHAEAATIAELPAIDWSRHFSRVCLDPMRGLITLMSPSRLHDDLAVILDDIVDIAGSVLTGGSKGLRTARLRGRGDPPRTGMEPDCAFYVGERARGVQRRARRRGGGSRCLLRRYRARLGGRGRDHERRRGKIERYGELGVRELWRLHGRKGTRELRVELLALCPRSVPRELEASEVLEGLTPTACLRGGGKDAARLDLHRTNGGRRPHCAPAPTRQRAGARGRRILPRRISRPPEERRGIRPLMVGSPQI